jgi:dihydroorotate dehydrogenase
VNLGRSKAARPDEAPADYAASLEALWPYADYVAVNVSSPNTPGLRDLQEGSALAAILDALDEVNRRRAREARVDTRPLLVKIAPDLGPAQVDAIVDLGLGRGLSGLIVANTTVAREGLSSPPVLAGQTGGLSGRPLRRRSTDLVRRVSRRAGSGLTVIGVGGVFTAQDAWEKLRAGASLVQLYTGFVYGGPATPARIAEGLLQRLEATGARSLSEVVGADG